MPISVEPLSRADLPGVGALFEAHTGRAPDLGLVESWIGLFPSAGASVAGELVGFLFCNRFAPDVLELANLMVAESHRRQGIAGKLLASIEPDAKRAGFAAIIVATSSLHETSAPRADGAELYRRLGFHRLHTTPNTTICVKPLN